MHRTAEPTGLYRSLNHTADTFQTHGVFEKNKTMDGTYVPGCVTCSPASCGVMEGGTNLSNVHHAVLLHVMQDAEK